MKQTILIVGDEFPSGAPLVELLRTENYQVDHTSTGTSAIEMCERQSYDLVVLDTQLPDLNGMDVCRRLRWSYGAALSILMLCERGAFPHRSLGNALGADDYVLRPCYSLALLSRIQTLLHARENTEPEQTVRELKSANLRLDLIHHMAWRGDAPLHLSSREFALLRYLMEHAGELVSRERLLREVWGYAEDVMSRTVDIHIVRLRRKLEAQPNQPELILTIHGMGYQFRGEVERDTRMDAASHWQLRLASLAR